MLYWQRVTPLQPAASEAKERAYRVVWFLRPAPENVRYVRLIAVLVAVDLVTKFLARWLLDVGHVDPMADLQLVLRTNRGLGSEQREIYDTAGPQLLFAAGFGNIAGAIGLRRSGGRGWSLWVRCVATVASYFLGLLLGMLASVPIGPLAGSGLALLVPPSGLYFWITLWRELSSGIGKIAVSCIVAAGAANLISTFTPPLGSVTDFIHSRFLLDGATFNVADVWYELGRLLVALAVLEALGRWGFAVVRRSRAG